MNILICRSDKIGDVVLTLPMCGLIKYLNPKATIYFLGETYTREVIDRCEHVDHVLIWSEIRQRGRRSAANFVRALNIDVSVHVLPDLTQAMVCAMARVPIRIGTSRRWYHHLFSNRTAPVSRRNSDLHESQLNIELIRPFAQELGISPSTFAQLDTSKTELSRFYGMRRRNLSPKLQGLLHPKKFNLIIHARSRGSAFEWPLKEFAKLANQLNPKDIHVILTGGPGEQQDIDELEKLIKIPCTNTAGKLELGELVDLIGHANGLIACSTGPLHIAASSSIWALGLYCQDAPFFPKRWGPIGQNAQAIEGPVEDHLLKIPVESLVERIQSQL